MEKLNPFRSELSIPAIQLLSMIDGGGEKIGEDEKQEIIQYIDYYNGDINMLIDLFFELINEHFLLLNSL